MAYNEARDLYSEMINMVKVSGVKHNRVSTYQDFDLFVSEFAQVHGRLKGLLEKLEQSKGQYTRFVRRAYKEALAWKVDYDQRQGQ